jgi:hypothetical protein
MASDCTTLRRRLTDGRRQLVATHTLTFTAQTTDDVSSTLGGQVGTSPIVTLEKQPVNMVGNLV